MGDEDVTSASLVGKHLAGRYRVLSRLGAGGMGTVYIAEQEPLQRKVALKLLRCASDPDASERFLREARAASRLNHPNIATVFDFGSSEWGPFLAMELVEGKTLRERMRDHKPLPWQEALVLVSQIARGLAAAHREGIVHRDIKPENLIVETTEAGEVVKILDFGLATLVNSEMSALTATGLIIGTAAYISPEQLNGINNDVRSDLYALGILFFEMLAGHHPFGCKGPMAFAIAHATQMPPSLSDLAPEIPAALCELVAGLLAKQPEKRLEDASALLQSLEALMRTHPELDLGQSSSPLPRLSDDAPSDWVTLVFTDIESSSKFWDRAPAAMRIALDTHNTIMRETLHRIGGYEVKTQGDSFMLAFASEVQALRFCLHAQRALRAATWPDEIAAEQDDAKTQANLFSESLGLKVRMGLHVGYPECRRDPVTDRMDYFGPVVNRAARIASAAHGGQILVGQLLAERLESDLLALDAKSQARGEHRLRGLDDREQLIEIVDLQAPKQHFPPPRALTEFTQSNISKDSNVFIGRANECAAIASRFRGASRLITLLGPGGTGKTRLARVVALELLQSAGGPEQAWFCDVSSARDAASLCAQVAAVLSVPLAGQQSASDATTRIARSLAARGPLLLVLDNVEQVVEAAAATVSRWLDSAPTLQILVTSRQVLATAGEERMELQPLDVERGIELFKARASELGHHIAAKKSVVAALVDALDGVPLAIELAASRVGLLSPEQILSRLTNRFELLRAQRSDGNTRQATLRGAIDWSWDLLSAVERDAFAQMASFEGGCSIEAAEEILDLSRHQEAHFALDVIQSLKEKSLLRAETTNSSELRIVMLRSIHDYSTEKFQELVNSGESVLVRHAQYFLREGKRQARLVCTSEGRSAIGWLSSNRQNLIAVVERFRDKQPDWAAAAIVVLQPLLAERDQAEIHRQLLDDAIELAKRAQDDVLGAEALLYRADLEQQNGNAQVALQRVNDARRLLEGKSAPGLSVLAHIRYGRAMHRMGKLDLSQAAFDEAEPLARALGTDRLIAFILIERGLLCLLRGLLDQNYLSDALLLAKRCGDRSLEARTLGNLGIEYLVRGQLDLAESTLLEAQELHRDSEARGLEGMALGNLGTVALAQGNAIKAEERLREAITIHTAMDNQLLVGADTGNLSAALLNQSRYRDAAIAAEFALPILQDVNAAREIHTCRCNLVIAYACLDQLEPARRVLRQVQDELERSKLPLANRMKIAAAALMLADARCSGAPASDRRIQHARSIVEELEADTDKSVFTIAAVREALQCYPLPLVDQSQAE